MKNHLIKLIATALTTITTTTAKPAIDPEAIQVDRCKDPTHGDFATNIALILAKPLQAKPRDIAEQIKAAIPLSEYIAKIEIAGPGFINFFLTPQAFSEVIVEIIDKKEKFGRAGCRDGLKINIEYVSCNPTGPLHVGHGRGAAIGDTIANLAEAVGFRVHREYYVNDAGRQMDILAVSIWLRYLERLGECIHFPFGGYQGDYIHDISASLENKYQNQFKFSGDVVFRELPGDSLEDDNAKNHYLDTLISRAKQLLGREDYDNVLLFGLNNILDDIRQDLAEFNVHFDEWFSERKLVGSEAINTALARLNEKGYLYQKDGATWFRSTDFGDDKDRVLIRENGQSTYFASDIAYHLNKFDRDYDYILDIWGADHHGYIPRVKAAITAMGENPEQFAVLLVQFAVLYRGKEKVQMSTRSGSFVTLRELREEVGSDAARYFYVNRKSDQHLDFDLELAKSKSNDNPIYYIQYAHARICSVLRQAKEKNIPIDLRCGLKQLSRLTQAHEIDLIKNLSAYPEIILQAGTHFEPHLLTHYLSRLATDFHAYYNAHPFLIDDENIRNARICLITATKQILANGLQLIGVSSPEQM